MKHPMCKVYKQLEHEMLYYRPKYTKSDEAIDVLEEHEIDTEPYWTPESRIEQDRLDDLCQEHLASCSDPYCKQIMKNRESQEYKEMSK
jgi:arsenate reductase-like glutaredoxin family protein